MHPVIAIIVAKPPNRSKYVEKTERFISLSFFNINYCILSLKKA